MLKKSWLLLVPALALVVLGVWWYWVSSRPASPISRQTYERIRLGMTLAEVEGVIGLPEGDHYGGSRKRARDISLSILYSSGKAYNPTHAWDDGTYIINITLDRDGKVIGCSLLHQTRTYASLTERILDLLGI